MSVSPDDSFSPPVVKVSVEKKGHGCFFWGCIISLILLVLGIIFVVISAVVLWRFANQQLGEYVREYTDTAPMTLPKPALSEDEQKELKTRFDAFKKALDEGKAAELTLTGDEITTLMNQEPELKDRAAVEIKDDKVTGDLSYPLPPRILGVDTAGRYLNGRATMKVSLADGVLLVTLDQLEVKGKPVPEQVMQALRAENLAKEVQNDRNNARKIQQLESIVVKNGKITIKSRAAESPSAVETKANEGEPAPTKAETKTKDETKTKATRKADGEPKPDEKAQPKTQGAQPGEEKKRSGADSTFVPGTKKRDVAVYALGDSISSGARETEQVVECAMSHFNPAS